MKLLLHWLISALALLALPYLLSSIQVSSFYVALIVAVILGLLNAIVRPILILLTLPVTLLTLGLFIFVINALLFQFVASFVQGFQVDGFWSAMGGSIIYSLITFILNTLVFGPKEPAGQDLPPR
jgi:putative membrane protein